MLPEIISTLGEVCSLAHKSKGNPFYANSFIFCLFCILLMAVCSYPWAVTLQLLAQLSRTAGNKSEINYSLLAPGLLDPGMAKVTRCPKGWEVEKDTRLSLKERELRSEPVLEIREKQVGYFNTAVVSSSSCWIFFFCLFFKNWLLKLGICRYLQVEGRSHCFLQLLGCRFTTQKNSIHSFMKTT